MIQETVTGRSRAGAQKGAQGWPWALRKPQHTGSERSIKTEHPGLNVRSPAGRREKACRSVRERRQGGSRESQRPGWGHLQRHTTRQSSKMRTRQYPQGRCYWPWHGQVQSAGGRCEPSWSHLRSEWQAGLLQTLAKENARQALKGNMGFWACSLFTTQSIHPVTSPF